LELVELELRELLSGYGFPGDDIPIVLGSARDALESPSTDPDAPEYACIWELMRVVDEYIPTRDVVR
jgi:elongation factor Tu